MNEMEISKDTALIPSLEVQKKISCVRFIILLLLCLMSSCFIFSYNSPGALQTDIMNQFSLNTFWFSLIYSAFYWPNILCFVGGYLLDRFLGVKFGTIIFVSISVVGNVVNAVGGFLNSFWLMVLGRFLYGCAGDSVAVSLNLYSILWFKGKELAFITAVNQSIPMLGASLIYQIAHPLLFYVRKSTTDYNALGTTLLIISGATMISFVCSILLAILYPKSKESLLDSDKVYRKGIIKLSDISKLPLQFWILCLVCDMFFNTVFSFIDLAQNYLRLHYNMNTEAADEVISAFSIISCLTSPLLGILVNYMGRNLYFIILSVMGSVMAHFLAACTNIEPYIIMCILAMSYSLMVGSVWPLFSLLADKSQQGSIYGFVMSTMNATLSVGVLISGYIIDEYGYRVVETYYFVTLLVVVGLSVAVWLIDKRRNGMLNKSPLERLFSQQSLNRSMSLETLH